MCVVIRAKFGTQAKGVIMRVYQLAQLAAQFDTANLVVALRVKNLHTQNIKLSDTFKSTLQTSVGKAK